MIEFEDFMSGTTRILSRSTDGRAATCSVLHTPAKGKPFELQVCVDGETLALMDALNGLKLSKAKRRGLVKAIVEYGEMQADRIRDQWAEQEAGADY